MYGRGVGVPQNDKEAVKWWRLAAEQRYIDAQFNLGQVYRTGKGVPQNYKEAANWYRLAAEQGHAKAQYNLGVMYDKGKGVPQNYAECYAWSSIAAAMGNGNAKHNRDICAKKLSPGALTQAQAKAAEYREKQIKGVSVDRFLRPFENQLAGAI